MRIEYVVTESDDGHRAVDVLCKNTGMSRLLSKKIRIYGSLLRNGEHCRMIDPVHSGDVLIAEYWPHGINLPPLRQDPDLPVIFQDDWLIVINKPAGLVIHPTYLHEKGTVTDRLADHPLHPVIRLDRDTTGVLPIALNGHAHHFITHHSMEKTYVALVHGRPPATEGIIDQPIGRHPESIMLRRIWDDGQQARTKWKLCQTFPDSDVSLVQFTLLTGRTHQIRVHSRSIGCPLLGDGLYGLASLADSDPMKTDPLHLQSDQLINRQALHAASLTFCHPISQTPQTVTAPLPDDFQSVLSALNRADNN